ncbi:hypothetical protein IR073_01435 [Gemella sp. 19428wG2_WT2a]|nr:hypothetical protein [Gemella sp. 19428wG2_WT2a]
MEKHYITEEFERINWEGARYREDLILLQNKNLIVLNVLICKRMLYCKQRKYKNRFN